MKTLPLIPAVVLCPFLLTSSPAASKPSPAYAWQGADTNTVLRWKAGSGEVSFNVYFGADPTLDATKFRGNQSETVYCPGTLLPNTHYYWRIDSVNASNVVTQGALWHFITGAAPGVITRVNLMPNGPDNYVLRDWKQTALDFSELVSDHTLTGPYLPIATEETSKHNIKRPSEAPGNPPFYWIPSFVGFNDDAGCLGGTVDIVGATLCGLDKTNHFGRNYVTAQASYYSIDISASTGYGGYGLIFHSHKADPTPSFWYQLIANIAFWQMVDLYPTVSGATSILGNNNVNYTLDGIMKNSAEKWHDVSEVLSTFVPSNPDPDYSYPGYAYYGFDFSTNQPNATGGTLMPHSAAGLAWLQYMASTYFTTDQADYLADADQAMSFFHDLDLNPSHDVLVPYGALTAARMNAELGRNYDVGKFINWHFDPDGDVNEHTGVEVGNYGSYPVDGLVGKPGLEKVYPVNTFMSAGILAPVARYDQRFARDIGKWLLNVAANARYFYSDGVPSSHQTQSGWCDDHDPNHALTYEFLANEAWIVSKAANYSSSFTGMWVGGASGTDVAATAANAPTARKFKDKSYLKFKPTGAGFSHILTISLPPGKRADGKAPHDFKVFGKVVGNDFRFSYSTSPTGPFTTILTMSNTDIKEVSKTFGSTGPASTVYIKIEDLGSGGGQLWIDSLLVQSRDIDKTPFLAGGHEGHGGFTNLCLYQGSSSGYLGAIVEPTNVTKILRLDLLATDFFREAAYPTFLYYNPFSTARSVNIAAGTNQDVYDTVTHGFLLTNVSGTQSVSIPANSVRVLVLMPTGLSRTYDGRKLKVNGVVVDYYYPVKTRLFHDNLESGSYSLGSWNASAYTSVIAGAAYSSNYGAKMSKTGSITKQASTAGFHGIYVKYRRATTGYGSGEGLIVEWSTNGTAWNNLETVNSGSYSDGLQNKSCGAGASNQASFYVRFRSNGSDTTKYSYVDNIEILGQTD